jgi:cobalt-zinc-cadmium efflux system membrane fusion protein
VTGRLWHFASLALALLAATGCRGAAAALEPPDDEVWLTAEEAKGARVVTVTEEDLPQTVRAVGKIAFHDLHVTHVFTPVSGRVTRVIAQPGQKVQKGSPLVTIASPDVGNAVSDVVRAQADTVATEREFARQRLLVAAQAGPQRDVETAEGNYRKAKAELERARQKAAQLRGNARAESISQEYTLRSYIDGEVMARNVSPGVEVQGLYSAGSAVELFTIGDIDTVWVLADVAEGDLPRVAVGASAEVRVVAYPGRVFEGTVAYVSNTLDPATRTAKIRCELPNPKWDLKPEMYASVAIRDGSKRALALPRDAVVKINALSFAYVDGGRRPDGRIIGKRKRIQLVDDAAGDRVEVLSGLAAGERVLIESTVTRKEANDVVWISDKQLAAAAITLAAAQTQQVVDAVSLGGRLTFDDQRITHVFAPVTGRITRVLAQLGERVKKGAPLLNILSPDVGAALSDVLKAQAELTSTAHEYQRQGELFEAHAGALKDFETTEANWRKAKAEYERAERKRQLLRLGEGDSVTQEYTLRSPIDGEVIARAVNPGVEVQGQYSGAGMTPELFTIGETDHLWVLGDVYEIDLPRIHEGDDVAVKVAAYPDRVFNGKVEWVGDVLDPVLRTAKVRCALDNPEHLLKPEMYEAVTVQVTATQVLAVPRQAVLRQGQEKVVFVLAARAQDGRTMFKRVPVQVNEERPGGMVPVRGGIKPGETVVVEGAIFLLGML